MSHLPQQVLYKLLSGHRAHLLHRTLLAGIVLKVVVPQHLLDHTLVYSLCVICYPCFRLHRQLHEQQLCTARTVRFSLQTVPLCEGTVVQQPLPLHAIQRFVNLTRFVLYRVGETKGPTWMESPLWASDSASTLASSPASSASAAVRIL